MGANKISIPQLREAKKLAPHRSRKPKPRIKKERRAPTRPTKKPAHALTATISNAPSHGCGAMIGASTRFDPSTKADRRESISPARHNAHVTNPANTARARDMSNDFKG